MSLTYAVYSERIKVKHTPFWAIHLCLPVMGAFLFIAYYLLYSSTADYQKLKMILEITATFFPLLISIIVGLNVTLEEKASHFQTLLAVPNRHKLMLAKLAYLYGTGVFALLCLFLLFVLGTHIFRIADTVQLGTLITTIAGIAFCNLIIYILHLFLSFKFGLGLSKIMNKNGKMLIPLLVSFVVCISLTGCSLQDKIKEYSSDKEQCYLNIENVTQFTYKENGYTILEDTVSNGGLGEWAGYIRQLAAVDAAGKILLQEKIETATFQSLADLADKAPEAEYVIPFLNVYAAPNADSYLIVDVNGEYHKAVINENIKDTDTVFDFKEIEQSAGGKFEINSQNATQLFCDGTVYQVTSDTVSDDELGSYIDIIAKSVTFDAETKMPLSKDDLNYTDWYGRNAGQGREQWFYTDVYEIYGTSKLEAVAVKINNHYYIAKRQ